MCRAIRLVAASDADNIADFLLRFTLFAFIKIYMGALSATCVVVLHSNGSLSVFIYNNVAVSALVSRGTKQRKYCLLIRACIRVR